MSTIAQFTTTNVLLPTDKALIQRGAEYYSVEAKSLTTAATISDTYANINTALGSDSLKAGAIYYISDKYIFLQALDNNKLSVNGWYYARNADYQSAGVYSGITTTAGFTVNATGTNLGVWYSGLTPASGDVVIYNGTHWLNITGAVGTAPSGDATNWEAVANTDITLTKTYGYIHEFDYIMYDFANDTILRREDKRGNSIGETAIAQFQWGNNNVYWNYTDNYSTFDCYNGIVTTMANNRLFYSRLDIKDSEILSGVAYNDLTHSQLWIKDVQSSTNVRRNTFSCGGTVFHLYDLNATAQSFNDNVISIGGATETAPSVYIYLNKNGSTSSKIWNKDLNEFSFNFAFTAAAYAGGTTYNYGDMVTSANVTYMYINETPAAGTGVPNATYWIEIFDNAVTDKMTINNTYLSWFGTFNITSTSATEDLKKIVVYTRYISPIKLIPAVGLDLTVDSTAYASLAASGEIMASADFTLEGNKREHCDIEYMGTVNSQTVWAVIHFTQYA